MAKEYNHKGYIHSTESFGTVDGPGVRFVVFFQGCPMRCLYCHNPDTWKTGEGKEMTAEEILEAYKKNEVFYKNGGITATGGEPLMQLDFLTELFQKAKKQGIHTCLDTSGIMYRKERQLHGIYRNYDAEKLHSDADHTDQGGGVGNYPAVRACDRQGGSGNQERRTITGANRDIYG